MGAAPAPEGQLINITINASSRLSTVEEFKNIRIRVLEDGSILRLKDVARIELNEEKFMGKASYNSLPATGVAVKLASGANVIDTTDGIKAELESLARFYPAGLKHAYGDDRAPIVKDSIKSVVSTLLEAIVLVVGVMFLFLQRFKSTVIPAVVVPVVLLGVFAVLATAGFSINTLTMFGMVLAIGLLVDDAIVVVENVERLMAEEGLSPREAAFKSMRQITGALVGVGVVISAVFVPMAFMSGSTGIIYRQFSITIVTAMLLSVFIAIVLTPAMCATMLDSKEKPKKKFFVWFNAWFDRLTRKYAVGVWKILKKPKRWLLFFGALLGLSLILFTELPTAFLPDEDQGMLYVDIQLPEGASFERTENVLAEVERYFIEEEGDSIKSTMGIMGWGFSGTGQSSGMYFPMLKDWSERGKGQGAFDIMERANAYFSTLPGANIFVMAPPAVLELGTSSGFDMEIMDRAGRGHEALMKAKDQLLDASYKEEAVSYVRYSGLDDQEQYALDIDSDKAGAYNLKMHTINGAISAYWGGEYINDFIDKGRTKRVYIQSEPEFRTSADDFWRYYVRNEKGDMVPFASFLEVKSIKSSPKLARYQGVPTVKIEGMTTPGFSSGQAMESMEKLAGELPYGFDFAWTGLSYQEQMAGDQGPILFAISVIVVFLTLAALYESWTIPFSVLLAVPTGFIGALLGVYLRGMNNDIYFQIALLTTIGLSAKNSILIVEFARILHKEGKSLMEATVEAARLRLRPIIMTSACFILGVFPLAISSGAGSGAQNALGTAVMSGMFSATGLGIFYTPLFFVLVTRFFASRKKSKVEIGLEAESQG